VKREFVVHGASFSGLFSWSGIIVLFLGVLCAVQNVFFVIPLLLIIYGFIMFMSVTGVEINYEESKIRRVLFLFPFKIGNWKTLSSFNELLLTNYNKAEHMPGLFADVQIRRYEIFLNNTHTKQKLLLKSCKSASLAEKKIEEFSQKLNFPKNDLLKKCWKKYHKKI